MTAKRMLALLLTLCLCICLCACTNVQQNAQGSDKLILWAEPSGAKYLQNDEGQIASTAAEKSVLRIQMAKNETEAGQLMLYAGEAVRVITSQFRTWFAAMPSSRQPVWRSFTNIIRTM